jgi:hypothetical protein
MSSNGARRASDFRETDSIEPKAVTATLSDRQPNTMTVGSTVALNSVNRPGSFGLSHNPECLAPRG